MLIALLLIGALLAYPVIAVLLIGALLAIPVIAILLIGALLAFLTELRIRKYFFRIWIRGAKILSFGPGSARIRIYIRILPRHFVPNEKNLLSSR
jgi:hypothetical protein